MDRVEAALAIALAVAAAWIVWSDLRTFIIPDAATALLAGLAAASRFGFGALAADGAGLALVAAGLDVALTGGLLLALREIWYRRTGREGVGFGDVKLAAAGGLLVGATGFAAALFAACLAALGFVAARRLRGRAMRPDDRIALGALLAPALWCIWMLQREAVLPAVLPPP